MRSLWPLPAILLYPALGFGQQSKQVDSNYVSTYEGMLTTRLYASQKYTSLTIKDGSTRYRYYPNTSFNIGIGATYQALSINLAYRAPFLNNDDDEKGDTKYLDLQAHIYPRHWTIDFYGQNYKGYFASNSVIPVGMAPNGVVRPDMRVNLYGLAAYRITNGRRFSFRAPLLQSEWQKKSAGTWLWGAELHAGQVRADSAFIPLSKENEFVQRGVDKLQLLQLGPGAGYAYTLVIAKHLFVTAAATVNLNLGLAKEFRDGSDKTDFTFSPNFIFRGALGYNSNKWMVSFTQTPNRLAIRNSGWNDPYIFSTGNFRFNIAHRFAAGPRLEKRMRILDPKD